MQAWKLAFALFKWTQHNAVSITKQSNWRLANGKANTASIFNIYWLKRLGISALLEKMNCNDAIGPGAAPFALDVGSGTGLLAMMAASCGASRVSTFVPEHIISTLYVYLRPDRFK